MGGNQRQTIKGSEFLKRKGYFGRISGCVNTGGDSIMVRTKIKKEKRKERRVFDKRDGRE